jgi:RNA polymerase sigma factor (TIGR02999 family)
VRANPRFPPTFTWCAKHLSRLRTLIIPTFAPVVVASQALAMSSPGDVTRLIQAIGRGESRSDELLDIVYTELRTMAAAAMAREHPGRTLQPTALVHEAYLRLIGDTRTSDGQLPPFENRAHFFAAAAEAMRRILVDEARRRHSLKRGGNLARAPMPADQAAPTDENPVNVLALNEALFRLEKEDPRMATIVKLRFFGEMSVDEVATALELSRRTVLRDWIAAKAWLMEVIDDQLGREPGP